MPNVKPLGIRLNIDNGAEFQKFIDSQANIYKPEDIIFISQEGYDRLSDRGGDIQEDEIATKNLSEVNPIQDPIHQKEKLFPLQISINEDIYSYKISNFDHSLLPIHAGTVPFINSIFFGLPNAGKSIYTIQMTSQIFLNMILESVTDSFPTDPFDIRSDIKMVRSVEDEKEKREEDFYENRIVPEPTPKGVRPFPSYFYIRYNLREVLLKVEDLAGETCAEINYSSKTILKSDTFVVMISAKDLWSQKKKVVDMINNLSMTVNAYTQLENAWVKRCKFIIVITKADLLPDYDQIVTNSLYLDDRGRWAMNVHQGALSGAKIKERSQAVKDMIKKYHIGLYRALQNLENQNHTLLYSLIASIGTEVNEQKQYTEYKPFNIDEPFLYMLNGFHVYPSDIIKPEKNEDWLDKVQKKIRSLADIIGGEGETE